jgi:hypothetical protein
MAFIIKTAEALPSFSFLDNFSEVTVDQQSSYSETNGVLTETARNELSGANANCILGYDSVPISGDFDTIVNFERKTAPATSTGWAYFFYAAIDSNNLMYTILQSQGGFGTINIQGTISIVGGSQTGDDGFGMDDTNTWWRLKRVGTLWTSYYANTVGRPTSGDWNLIHSRTIGSGDVTTLRLGTDAGGSPPFEAVSEWRSFEFGSSLTF